MTKRLMTKRLKDNSKKSMITIILGDKNDSPFGLNVPMIALGL